VILDFSLPFIMPKMTDAVVHALVAAEGGKVAVGQGLMDLMVDLSAAYAHDCPPISYFRIVSREGVWLRKLFVAEGERPSIGEVLARFSTTADEPLDRPAARQLRVMVAGVTRSSHGSLW